MNTARLFLPLLLPLASIFGSLLLYRFGFYPRKEDIRGGMAVILLFSAYLEFILSGSPGTTLVAPYLVADGLGYGVSLIVSCFFLGSVHLVFSERDSGKRERLWTAVWFLLTLLVQKSLLLSNHMLSGLILLETLSFLQHCRMYEHRTALSDTVIHDAFWREALTLLWGVAGVVLIMNGGGQLTAPFSATAQSSTELLGRLFFLIYLLSKLSLVPFAHLAAPSTGGIGTLQLTAFLPRLCVFVFFFRLFRADTLLSAPLAGAILLGSLVLSFSATWRRFQTRQFLLSWFTLVGSLIWSFYAVSSDRTALSAVLLFSIVGTLAAFQLMFHLVERLETFLGRESQLSDLWLIVGQGGMVKVPVVVAGLSLMLLPLSYLSHAVLELVTQLHLEWNSIWFLSYLAFGVGTVMLALKWLSCHLGVKDRPTPLSPPFEYRGSFAVWIWCLLLVMMGISPRFLLNWMETCVAAAYSTVL